MKAAPEREIKFPGADIEFNISSEDIKALKTAALFIVFQTFLSLLLMERLLSNSSDDTSNVYELSLETLLHDLIMKMENLRLQLVTIT